MADYYAIITQKGYSLEVSDVNLPHQFSSNIPIKIVKDSSVFSNYDLLPFFVHSTSQYIDVVRANEGTLMEYDETSQIATLPYSAFSKKGYLFISLAMKEQNGNKTMYTGSARFKIEESINGENTIPVESVWIDAITKYVDTYMNEKYKPTYDALLENAEDLQEQAESLHTTVTQQQQSINNTLQTTQGLQEDIEEINETTKQLQQTTTQLQNNVNLTVQKATQQQDQIDDSIEVMGDYEIVQENPTQIRFKKGDGTYGNTVNLGDNLASKSMVNAGYDTYSGNSYSGTASDYGIEIGKASGNYKQEGTPTPESPVEPKFFEPKNVYSVGTQLWQNPTGQTSRGVTLTVLDDGWVQLDGTCTASYNFGNTIGHSLKSGNYTLSVEKQGVFPDNDLALVQVYSNATNSEIAIANNSSSSSFGTLNEADYLFRIRIENGFTYNNVKLRVMFQNGDVATSWEPYRDNTTPLDITLRALPNDVCDTYEKRVITRRVGKVFFDGSDDESWVYNSTLTNTYQFSININANGLNGANGISNCFEFKDNYNDNEHIKVASNGYIYLHISKDRLNGRTIDDLKTWLYSNPIDVYYELSTPTTEYYSFPIIPSYHPYTNAWHDSEVEANDLTWFINTYARNSEYTDEFLQKFFALQRTGKVYTVRFPLFSKSTSPIGEKMDHNEGLTCNPSTDTIIGQDDYQDIPLFKTYDVNAYSDDNGRIHVTAFKGDKYFKDTGKVDVFVLGMSYYEKYWEDDNYWYYSRTDMPRNGYTLCAECRNTDGSKSSYALYSKYVSGEIDGKPYSSKGLIPKRNMSYNVCESYYHSRGKNYGGSPMYLYKYLMTTFYLKYATLNTQSKIYGCFNYSYQYAASMAENNVKRIVLTTAQAANIVVGSYVSIGDKGSNSSVDRGNSYMHNKAEEVEVISKTTVDDSHVAINVDSPTSFNTTTTTYLSTMHWKSGFSDKVLGRDGSIGDLTSGKYPMILQGIELAVGGYEVAGNAFMDIVSSTGKRGIYVTNDNSKIVTNVTNAKATYNKSKNSSQPTTLSAWNYITKMALDEENGMFNVIECGNSGSGSATGFCDGFYVDSATSGQREFLLLGVLGVTAFCGLSCVNASCSLSAANWHFLARLSISGRKG